MGNRPLHWLICVFLMLPGAEASALHHESAMPPAGQVVSVRVVAVHADGKEAPVEDAAVMLEAWTRPPGRMQERLLDTGWTSRTDHEGVARFEIVSWPKGSELIATLVDDGITYKGEAITLANASNPIEIRTYETTSSRATLSASMHVSLSIRDGFVIVDSAMTLSNSGRRLVELGADDDGLRLPILFPAVFSEPVNLGFVAEDTGKSHMSLRIMPPQGFFEIDQGAVWFHGPVPPGQGPTVQARYALPIIAERQDMALSVPLPVDSFILSTEWNRQVAPWVVPMHEFRVVERRQGESVQRFLRVGDTLNAGESVVIQIDHLPVSQRVYRDVALHGSLGLCGVFFMFFMVIRRRHV